MIVLVLAVLAFASFTSAFADTQSVEMSGALIGSPFNMHINETTAIESENIMIKLQNITDDSRCPSDVTCIWQGTIHLELSIKKDNNNYTMSLEPEKNTKVFDGYSIELQKVEPYPKTTQPIQQDQYVATFLVDKATQKPIPPLNQFRAGTPFDKIQCKENLVLIMKSSDGTPACVSQKTKMILIERGWAANQ